MKCIREAFGIKFWIKFQIFVFVTRIFLKLGLPKKEAKVKLDSILFHEMHKRGMIEEV